MMLFFTLFSSVLFSAQEIERIDNIVNDIEKLRHSYEKQLLSLRQKSKILQSENRDYKKEIAHLKAQIEVLNRKLKREKPKKIVLAQAVCKEENKFPKLKLKKSQIFHFKASAFRLREDADIYGDKESLKIIDRWERGTSFTSNARTKTRVKITGYFVDKVWKKADKEMWIDLSSVKQR